MKLLTLSFQRFLIFAALAACATDLMALQKIKAADPVKIGLLIPDNKSLAARHGAEMAIRKANENGGFDSRPFQLVVRSVDGPWGTGSKEAVSLIFDEGVLAIAGSLDGRNAHLVEQVATKARIVFLSVWASDPTLSQAFVPWYFSCVPNDLQQAAALIQEIYYNRKFVRTAVCSDSSYDSRLAVKSLLKKTRAAGKTDPLQFYYNNTDQSINDLTERLKKVTVDCIYISGQPSVSLRLIRQIKSEINDMTVYGSLALLDENQLSGQYLMNYQNVVLVSAGDWLSHEVTAFCGEYRRIYGNLPGEVAAYSYDGINLLIQAIKDAGPDREKIQKSLKEIKFEGVTGPIQFDDRGNRKGEVSLMQIINGTRVPLER